MVTLPNGVVIEAAVQYLDHKCALCSDPAIRLHIPRYETIEEFVTDQWCLEHSNMIIEMAETVAAQRKQLREDMLLPFRPWRRLTWWQAKLFVRKMLGG